MELHHATIHGHDIAFRHEGRGPLLVLIHRLAGSSATWRYVIPALARRFTVVAPDLLGHGASAKPRTDYSLGAYASGIRDLIVALVRVLEEFVDATEAARVSVERWRELLTNNGCAA
jgi:pimeloyl-ACP methyl ester carboxylesterase